MDLTKPFRELLERRLWPVALLLVLALAAVPLLLSRDAESSPAPPVTATASTGTEPVVDVADPAARDAARRVIGREKDPFRAAATPTPTAKPETAGDDAKGAGDAPSSSSSSGGGSGSGSGSSSGSGSATPSGAPAAPAPTAAPAPAPTAEPAPEPSFPLHSLRVRFGTVDNPDHADRVLSRLSGLPKGTTPALLYMGLKADRKTAVFLVRDNVTVLGDGSCVPRPGNCERLEMRKGDIEFVGVPGGGQYQVEVLDINARRTSSASAARAARTHTFPGGKRWLAAMRSHSAGLHYDADDGVLRPG